MANKEHLARLKQGIKNWNDWRRKHPEIDPDLSRASLSKIDLSRTNLSRVNFSEADLSGARFNKANLTGARLHKADLFGATLHKADLSGVMARNADLTWVELSGANLCHANFGEADLSEATLSGANLRGTVLRGAMLCGATLIGATLTHSNLSQGNLNRTELIGADLSGADLSAVQARGSNFHRAILTGACLQDWSIDRTTNLDGVECDYIYLLRQQSAKPEQWLFQRRRPADLNKTFRPGEFSQLFQQSPIAIDLIFCNGINWEALAQSLQQLQMKSGTATLTLQSLENKGNGTFVVRATLPLKGNKAEIQRFVRREYESRRKAIEAGYRAALQVNDREMERYRRKSADLVEMAKVLATGRPQYDQHGALVYGVAPGWAEMPFSNPYSRPKHLDSGTPMNQ